MQINLNTQYSKPYFGMAIKADEKAIRKLADVLHNRRDYIFTLNELIASQSQKSTDIFLSTDRFNNLTTRVGDLTDIKECPAFDAIQTIQNAASFVDFVERNQMLENVYKQGVDKVISQVINKIKIDK